MWRLTKFFLSILDPVLEFLEKLANAMGSNSDFGIKLFFKGYDELKAKSPSKARLVKLIFGLSVVCLVFGLVWGLHYVQCDLNHAKICDRFVNI